MAQSKKTLYQILGVPREASQIDIGLAHEMRAAELERRSPPDPSTQALVQQAFEILSNPKRRAAYDAQLLTAAEKSAAAEQATTDLEIGEDEPAKPKVPMIAIVIAVVVAVVALFFVLRPADAPKPAPVAAAPKAAPPAPPKLRGSTEIVADASTSAGQVMSYSMSGSAEPIGMALAIDTGTMVTTCHGIPAGGKLVVRVGKEQLPADLTITDETLDLCRLALTGFTKPPFRLADEEPKEGDKIFTVTFNAKGELTAAEGTIKGWKKSAAGSVLEISTPIAATASGAGVFDQYGKLVGIATTPHNYGAGLNVALPATWLAQMRSRTTPAK